MNNNNQKCNSTILTKDILNNDTINVSTGEVCTISVAKKYGLFNSKTFFNSSIPQNDVKYIDVYSNNVINKEMKYSLCSLSLNDNSSIENCILSTNNIWKVLDNTGSKCSLPSNITLPDTLKYNKTNSNLINKPNNIYKYRAKNNYCQEQWYDWFTIPDYHLGNTYKIIESSNSSKCYKPCDFGNIPEIEIDKTTNETKNICILKDDYKYGIYKGTFNYLPVALIILLGSTKETLINNYLNILSSTKTFSEEKGFNIDDKLYDNLYNNEITKNNIYKDIKKTLNEAINTLMNQPFDYTNIIEPSGNIATISNIIMTKERLEFAYDIAKIFYNFTIATDPKIISEYNEWKKNLADINGFDITNYKFNKQLLLLKRACNVAFDGKTAYSNNTILYILNKNIGNNDIIKTPIVFNIKDEDVVLAISSNNTQNNMTTTITPEIIDIQNTNKSINDDLILNDKISNKVSDNALNIDTVRPQVLDERVLSLFKNIFNFFIYALIIIIIVYILCFIIFVFLYKPFVSIINKIIMYIIYIWYYFLDLIRNKYTPPKRFIKISKLSSRNMDKKIEKDKVEFTNPDNVI